MSSDRGLRSITELMKTADLVRSMLAISPGAYQRAQTAYGREQAAVIAMMLERAKAIGSSDGYLRTLTQRAEAGQLSLLPMLQALDQAKG